MHYWIALIFSITTVACNSNFSNNGLPSEKITAEKPNELKNTVSGSLNNIAKSPHGYVINGPKARFGGFIGDCASDENFLYYWECQAENGGDNLH